MANNIINLLLLIKSFINGLWSRLKGRLRDFKVCNKQKDEMRSVCNLTWTPLRFNNKKYFSIRIACPEKRQTWHRGQH